MTALFSLMTFGNKMSIWKLILLITLIFLCEKQIVIVSPTISKFLCIPRIISLAQSCFRKETSKSVLNISLKIMQNFQDGWVLESFLQILKKCQINQLKTVTESKLLI